MTQSVMINLPVKDVVAAGNFYTKLGFALNPQFSSDETAMVAFNKGCSLMLVAEDFFKKNTGRRVADTITFSEVSLAIQVADRTEVDRIIKAGAAVGGKQVGETVEEAEIGLYSRGLVDLDGHKLDFLCMNA